jgi:phosphoglycolate phosphatase
LQARFPVDAVLFDLDGTLLDTAPDMGDALNELLREHGLSPRTPADMRPWVSHGSHGLVRLGFPDATGAVFDALRQRFLDLYALNVAAQTRLFDGGEELLDALEDWGIPWGIVTNKPGAYTQPLLAALALADRAGVVVSGDTLPVRKPDPAPLRHAADALGVPPARTVYVGDAERDMQAARAAGMQAVVARFGYVTHPDATREWPQDLAIESLAELQAWLAAGVE